MNDLVKRLRALSPSVASAPRADDEWAQSPLSRLSDAALTSAVAAAIATPKIEADTSFLTHAPLELLARHALLAMAPPEARDQIRRRIAAVAATYARAGDEIDAPGRAFASVAVAIDACRGAVREGDVETADAALVFALPRVSARALGAALAETILPQLGAAGHAPILLAEMARVDGRIDAVGALLRAPLRAIVRVHDGRLTWQERRDSRAYSGDGAVELARRLAAVPSRPSPSSYILPTMQAVEADGFAASLLGDVTRDLSVDGARAAILRVALLSMLQDDPDAAPYGWTHALTMPMAVLDAAGAVADPASAVRIAATYALGFRATLRKRTIDLDAPAPEAATADRDTPWTRLIAAAAKHEDAHFAKYVLAAHDAAAAVPSLAPLCRAAAERLAAWWDEHPGAAFE